MFDPSLSPYLQGPYAPIDDERDVECTEIIGEVPRDLLGTYVRNGPNTRFTPKGRYHWFDGDGMLHAVRFENGRVHYRNRWVRTRGLQREVDAGQALWSGVMESVRENPKEMLYKDTANTDVILHNGKLLALWYICGAPYAIDPKTLETLGEETFGGLRKTPVSAHAKVDPRTGELMYFDYQFRPPFLRYSVVDAKGNLVRTVPLEVGGPRLPHDMAITENYSVLMDLPVHFDTEALKTGRWRTMYKPDVPARFAVIPRHGSASDVRWFEAASCYIYHVVNAWEENDSIVMIACRVEDPIPTPDPTDGAWAAMLANLRVRARLHRWRFDLKTGQTHEEHLDDRNTEFPTIDASLRGVRSRYCYNVNLAPTRTILFEGLTRYDTETMQSSSYAFGAGRWGSESPFAPRENAQAEDDGYVLSFVYDEQTQRSEVVVLRAQALSDGPVARVMLPRRVPAGFHATWVAG